MNTKQILAGLAFAEQEIAGATEEISSLAERLPDHQRQTLIQAYLCLRDGHRAIIQAIGSIKDTL